jgi:SAM-dependent methyltransferase
MDAHEYEKMVEVEDRMWWYQGLHGNLALVVDRFLPAPGARLLDAGCGTGGLLRALGGVPARFRLFGLDAWQPACGLARKRSRRPVVNGTIERLPFADGALDGIVSADVLCHGGVDAPSALREARRCLRPDGVLVLNLPAYQWLLSYHDRRVNNVQRFTRHGLVRLLAQAGFHPVYATYWNTVLFPVMVLRRLTQRPDQTESDVHAYPAPVDGLCRALLAGERALLRAGMRLPVGGSVLVAARRRDG